MSLLTITKTNSIFSYDKEKYREMILDAAETVLGILDLIEPFTEMKGTQEQENGGGYMN